MYMIQFERLSISLNCFELLVLIIMCSQEFFYKHKKLIGDLFYSHIIRAKIFKMPQQTIGNKLFINHLPMNIADLYITPNYICNINECISISVYD